MFMLVLQFSLKVMLILTCYLTGIQSNMVENVVQLEVQCKRAVTLASVDFELIPFFSSPEPKAHGELIVWDSSRRPSVRACVCPSTLSNTNISETSRPIIIKFHQEHHWGGGLTALGFG